LSSGNFFAERAWLAQPLGCDEADIRFQLIAGDASPRKFYRVSLSSDENLETQVLMVSPPTENNESFLLVHGLLDAANHRVPKLRRADMSLGFFLLEDLGDTTFLSALKNADIDAFYGSALSALGNMQALDPPPDVLPIYDDVELQRELNVCPDWFFTRVLSLPPKVSDQRIFERFSACLRHIAAEQPFGFVHRDYHSRNLMVLKDHEIAIIDFQDAIFGPITYDAVSLLKDVYIVWPRAQQLVWLKQYWELLVETGRLASDSWGDFLRWFDLIGLQRHVKILGVFSRLWLRDHKPAYMRDIPVVIDYIREACALYREQYSAIADFWQWFEIAILPTATQAEWYVEA